MFEKKAKYKKLEFMSVALKRKPKAKAQDWLFKKVHTKNLVYNTCWEDPRCDRALMNLNEDSKVVMITSAGCNALDYLLDKPSEIHCIDMNYRQNSLLQLKKAAIDSGSFDLLFQLFGKGLCRTIKNTYPKILRPKLPEYAQEYWDKHKNYFNGRGMRRSFYYQGTAGTFAWLTERYLKVHKSHGTVLQLVNAENLDKQRHLYYRVEDKITNVVLEWLLDRHITMSLLGVPRSQRELFATKYENGALGFIQECLRKVFTELSIQDNYFWRLYMTGEYTMDCCPNYLKRENFETLHEHHERVQTYTTTISQFLKDNPGKYSHYVLLDHQDWLAANDVPALEEEWRLILENSQSGTKILLRSAAFKADFIPSFVRERIEFETEETKKQHFLDRVGTYASVYFGTVK